MSLLYLEYEIKLNIFKYIDSPINLAVSCKSWSIVAKDPYAKVQWLLRKFGTIHAFFFGVKLGSTFINENVCNILFAKKVMLSRYFIQRLMLQFTTFYPKLLDNADQNRGFWAHDIRLGTLFSILTQGKAQFGEELTLKGNDMDHFYYLSGGPYLYTSANIPLKYNVNQIKDFIISKKFIPFPSKSQLFFYDRNDCDLNIHESYPPFDGYEPYKNLNIIARAIIMEPDLVNIWKSIGYSEICDDFNELVFQGSFLTLYPPTKNQDWSFPEFDDIFPKFKKLVEIGFRLNDNIIVDVLQFYEHDLVELGELLWKIFCTIRSDEPESTFIFGLFKAAFDPNRCHGREYILNFLKSKTKDHESFIKQILIHHFKRENLDDINFNTRQKSFIFSPIIYEFLLKNYGSKSDLSLMCFKDILALRIYFDDPKNLDLANISTYTFDYILEVYNLYKESIEYLPEHLELLNRAKSSDVIKPFLENFVPKILQSNDINRSIWLNVLYSLSGNDDNYFINYLLRLFENSTF